MLVKVCGMREPENIREVAALRPDFLGFIFYPKSSRYAEGSINEEVLAALPATTKKVGVFVNASTAAVLEAAAKYKFNLLQLHGHESPEQCRELQEAGYQVVKAFSVDDNFNFEDLQPYENSCDYYLFDTKGKNYGGNGVVFNWEILEQYPSDKPYFLSGGLNLENISGIHGIKKKPFALDVNSGFELAPGLKDVEKVKTLLKDYKKPL
ncbi:phosphoribosylanthranilate isomerase [Botryobacter ruber]|uniref:phosphoribosylanthranilate isomerase n=1 Tax=Botryobacter ruber TaxID=2171629 RepID=UPI000E0B8C61|nr:phosphoribosylanthranilate isomerase [Botryobacter ruber]